MTAHWKPRHNRNVKLPCGRHITFRNSGSGCYLLAYVFPNAFPTAVMLRRIRALGQVA